MSARLIRTLAVVAALAVIAVVLVTRVAGGSDRNTLSATFPSTISLYEGAKVKVLGVQVGEVTSIEVEGTVVNVEMEYDEDVALPADVHALIVPPSIVGDRFIQLAPAYESGPKLEDGANLSIERTAVPLELDDVYRNLDSFTAALGPDGANKNGALSRLIRAGAANLSGNGRLFNKAIRELSGALDTLAASSGDFSGTIDNLASLNHTLAGKDSEIRSLVRNLATISATLNGQRSDLRSSVTSLNTALEAVGKFTRDNKGELTETISRLTSVTSTLASETDALTELADLAPVGIVSLGNIYQPRNWDISKPEVGSIDGRMGSAAIRADFFADLETQLSFSLGALCANLPGAQAAQLAPFCTALHNAGGSLGGVLQAVIAAEGFALTNPVGAAERPSGLAGLLGGGR